MIGERLWLLPEDEKPKKRVVGVIGDTHFPFTHKGYLNFCVKTFIEFGVTDIVHIGDMFDNHAISRHLTEAEALGAKNEYYQAKKMVAKWIKVFPEMKITLGSHDRIPLRQAQSMGLYEGFIKTFHEAWNLPDTWIADTKFIINGVKYHHGTRSGKMAGYAGAVDSQMSTVQGHTHGYAGVQYMSTETKLTFGMTVGCGVDEQAYAFNYGKEFPQKQIVSCGVVVNSKEAYVIPMTKRY